MNAAERVRRRIAELLAERGWTQAALAAALGKTSPWMSQLLSGRLNLGLDELDAVALACGSTAVELVRDPEQFQYCADLTPSEMAMLRRYRKLGPSIRDALSLIVQAIEATDRAGQGVVTHGPVPASPTELHHVVSAFANQIHQYVAESSQESRRQATGTRPALAPALRRRRAAGGRVAKHD